MQQNIQHLITHIPTQEETEQTGQNWQQQIARQDMAK